MLPASAGFPPSKRRDSFRRWPVARRGWRCGAGPGLAVRGAPGLAMRAAPGLAMRAAPGLAMRAAPGLAMRAATTSGLP